MNPVKPNLQSLRDDIVGFKQEFCQLKSETSSCPHKLTLQCLQCLPRSVESSVELSEDAYETFERFKTHLTDSKHEKHVHNLKTFRIHCTSCNGDLVLQNNFSACQNSIIGHLKSTKHETVYRALLSNAFCSLTSRFTALQCQVKELDGKLDTIIGKFEMIETGQNIPSKESAVGDNRLSAGKSQGVTKKPESVLPSKPQPATTKSECVLPQTVTPKTQTKPQPESTKPTVVFCPSVFRVEYLQPQTVSTKPQPTVAAKPVSAFPNHQPAVKYPSNATIVCNACKCAVSCSRDPGAILGNVSIHLQGINHQININKTDERSIRCCRCQFTVLISTDWSSSFEIMETHVYGCRHSPDGEEDMSIICNVCECSISPDYWSWQDEDVVMLDTIWEHLNTFWHTSHMNVAINKTICCSKCNCDISISENPNAAFSSMREHINEHSKSNEEQQSEEMDEDGAVIICNVCKVVIAASYDPEVKDNDSMIRSLMNHLEDDKQHDQYLMMTNRKHSLWCTKCNYPIPISMDLQSSFQNISNHINTSRHYSRN